MKKSNTKITEFCNRNNITEDQFYGKDTVGGSLYLRSLTSIPEGFNPTVGGSLYLRSLTSIPEGFNPTVGGSLYLRRGLSAKTTKPKSDFDTPKNKLLFWKNGKFVSADRILTEVINKKGNIYKVRKIHSTKEFYLVSDGKTHAHGDSIKSAQEDFRFKLISEKLKKEPIDPETELTVMHYRTITGACDIGCRDFMQRNSIPFKVENNKTIEVNPIKAKDLLPLLEKNNAYGIERFRSLITF